MSNEESEPVSVETPEIVREEELSTEVIQEEEVPGDDLAGVKRSFSREDSLGEVPEPVESASDDSMFNNKNKQSDDELDEELNLPPGRMHATRVPERLSGSTGKLEVPPGLNSVIAQKRKEYSKVCASPRSRSRSPITKATMATSTDANSSISSLDDIVDQDILLDRGGVIDNLLDNDSGSARGHRLHGSKEFINLPPVTERMCEDSLDDVHAFSDAVFTRSSNASRANSIATGNEAMLEPLNECDDEDDLDNISEGTDEEEQRVILTGLDHLTIEERHNQRGTATEGSTSLVGEAPSAPTA